MNQNEAGKGRGVGHELAAGAVVSDRYEVLGVISKGADGVTYRAFDRVISREVAVRELWLWGQHDWKALERFNAEGRILRQLRHPCIPRYLAELQVATDRGDAFYIIHEIAPGRSLRDWVDGGRHFTAAEVEAAGTALLDCLAYLAGRTPPVVHRDIRPDNVVLAEDGRVALVNFGAVRQAVTASGTGTFGGAVGYLAPKQLLGRATPQSDLYGVAATLAFMATGRDPVSLRKPSGRVDAASIPVSPRLRRLLARCLVERPDRRPAGAAAAAAQLRAPSPVYGHALFALAGFAAAVAVAMAASALVPAAPLPSSLPPVLETALARCRLQDDPHTCITEGAVRDRSAEQCAAVTLLRSGGAIEYCLVEVGVATKSAAPCALEIYNRDACRLKVALGTSQGALCDEIWKPHDRDECWTKVAYKSRDPKACERVSFERYGSCRAQLLDDIAGKPVDICRAVPYWDRQACAEHFARREPRVCGLLHHLGRMECFRKALRDIATSDGSASVAYRAFCAAQSPADRQGCLYAAGVSFPDACLDLENEGLRDPCRVAAAAAKRNVGRCRSLPPGLWQACVLEADLLQLPGACELLDPEWREGCLARRDSGPRRIPVPYGERGTQ